MRKGSQPMTRGSIPRHLLRYSIPAILGDLFQLTYNTVDSVIVGRYAGAGALAAVGVASPLMNVAMFFIIGMGIGASVLMSEFYGAGDMRSMRREFATTMAMSTALSALIAAALYALAVPLLRLCRTPAEIMADTAGYLRVVAVGMIVTSLYNILAAVSRSIGNTVTPLVCLVAASLLNVALDIWFVAGLGWGVAGAAYATVISQGAAAVLCAALLYRGERVMFAERRDFRVDRALLKRTFRFSYPSALQQAGVYVGKLLVQSAVNPLGVSAIAAFNAVNRIDDYAIVPERDIASGETVLVAQNHGAKQPERMRDGLRAALIMETVYGFVASIAVFALARPLMALFVAPEETEVIRLGAHYLRLMGFFYILPGINNGLQGYMRAIGRMNIAMYATYSQMLVRAVLTFLMVGWLRLDAVPLACAAGWIWMMAFEVSRIVKWRKAGKLYAL